MKILLIGEKNSTNLGDGVIFDIVSNILKDEYNCNILEFDISKGDTGTSNENLWNRNIKLKIKKIISKNKFIKKKLSLIRRILRVKSKLKKINFEEIDYAIFCGGQLFFEYFINPIYTICKVLKNKNVPIIFNCCGLGKTSNKSDKLLRTVVNQENVKAVSIRDNKDKFIEKYSDKVKLVLDPVFEIKKYNNYKLIKGNSNIIGIGLMEIDVYRHNNILLKANDYEELVLSIIKKIEDLGKQWEFFCNGALEDYNYISNICNKYKFKNKIVKRPETPEELVNTIIKYDKIISFRLHSHIIATSFNIPSIGFVWDKKIRDFSKNIDREKFFIDLNKDVVNNFKKVSEEFFDINGKISPNSNCIYDSEFLKSLELKK